MSETFINKVITKAGDSGNTNLVYKDVHKSEPIIECIGCIDEANASIGMARHLLDAALVEFTETLDEVQSNLFDLAADLICGSEKINDQYIDKIERIAAEINTKLVPLQSFVLPKGPAAVMHVARATVRRAERAFWAYTKVLDGVAMGAEVNTLPGIYLNRLSDLLFIICRSISDKEEQWVRLK